MECSPITIRCVYAFVILVAGIGGLLSALSKWDEPLACPDVVDVTVATALPGRPISGERLVFVDGTISLGYYGRVKVAGLSAREAKAKVVLHLRRYLTDQTLGLIESGPDTDGVRPILRRISPSETERVTVQVTRKNSRRPGLVEWVIRNVQHLLDRTDLL